jgi:hypothetical protein
MRLASSAGRTRLDTIRFNSSTFAPAEGGNATSSSPRFAAEGAGTSR